MADGIVARESKGRARREERIDVDVTQIAYEADVSLYNLPYIITYTAGTSAKCCPAVEFHFRPGAVRGAIWSNKRQQNPNPPHPNL